MLTDELAPNKVTFGMEVSVGVSKDIPGVPCSGSGTIEFAALANREGRGVLSLGYCKEAA